MPRYDLKVSRFTWANGGKVYTSISAETVGPYYALETAKLNARLMVIGDSDIFSVAIEYNEFQPAIFIIYRDHDYDDPVALKAIQGTEKRIGV